MVNTLINNPGATTFPRGGRKSNRRKKSMKKKGKTAKKRKTKKARKTRRRKGAGNPVIPVIPPGKQMYRSLHKFVRGKKSKGEQNEIQAAAADKVAAYKAAADAKAEKDAKYLTQIRRDRSYTEMDDIAHLDTNDTYVEYQGADIYPPLFPLGKFIEKDYGAYGGPLYGIPITLKFEKKKLEGYFRTNAERWLKNNTSINGLIFKVNSDAKEEEEDGEGPFSFSDNTGVEREDNK